MGFLRNKLRFILCLFNWDNGVLSCSCLHLLPHLSEPCQRFLRLLLIYSNVSFLIFLKSGIWSEDLRNFFLLLFQCRVNGCIQPENTCIIVSFVLLVLLLLFPQFFDLVFPGSASLIRLISRFYRLLRSGSFGIRQVLQTILKES